MSAARKPLEQAADNRRMNNDRHLDDLLWLWSLARRPLCALLVDMEAWPASYRPRACA